MNEEYINENIRCLSDTKNNYKINDVLKILIECVKNDNKILFIGNGGSSCDSIHIVSELVDKYVDEKRVINSIALSSNVASITAISNDYEFNAIYERQLISIGRKNDVLVALSTSGKSVNILNTIDKANSLGIKTILFTGRNITSNALITINIDSNITSIIQNTYMVLLHMICDGLTKEVL